MWNIFGLTGVHTGIVLSSLLICAISGAVIYVINSHKRKREYVKVAKVLKLIIYPIKSLPGIEVESASVTKCGLQFGPFRDRSWMLISDEHRFITQRTESSLALLKTSFHENELWIDGPNLQTLKLKVKNKCKSNDQIIKTNVWGQPVEGIDCGKEAEEWFSQYLQKPGTKLIQHIPQLLMRQSGAQINNNIVKLKEFPIVYQDGSGVLVINDNSIKTLNDKLPEDNKVSHRNFRPNILISECDSHEEDKWQFVNINNIDFTNLKPCDRCVLTTINPDTGEKLNHEPLQTLRTYRLADKQMKKHYGESPLFGINLGPENEGIINCGDDILAVYHNSP